MIEYYDRLEEVDKELEAIHRWQQEELIKLYAETKIKMDAALSKLGETIPQEIKEKNSGSR
jgi:hypothetical protein